MVARSSRRYTFEDYLGVEEASTIRHEYLDGDIFAIAGVTPEHAALSAAIVTLLGAHLRGGLVALTAPTCAFGFSIRASRPMRTRPSSAVNRSATPNRLPM